jgi:exopolyphosphatase/guanosine-5'-triphosphate,3'-diphosphate pyrophosphatase
VAWHRVRIALKRFRYTVENFLPRQYAEWADDLKSAQDWLGEVHDLDVLRAAVHRYAGNIDLNLLETWNARIDAARAERLNAYRTKAKGRHSLWNVWRAGLPGGERLERAAMATLTAWASFEDPDFDHAQHVSKLALNLWDAFHDAGMHRIFDEPRTRRILEAAALLHDVGRAKKDSGHHKISCKMIQKHAPPLGWTSDEMLWTALIARYHSGAEPRADQADFSTLLPDERENVSWLAAVLRLADALDANHKGRITGISVESVHPAVMLRADGYVHDVESAGIIARKKHLLETLCGRAVIVQPMDATPLVVAAPVTSLAS